MIVGYVVVFVVGFALVYGFGRIAYLSSKA